MQGNLSEIDIRSILQLIELGQRTGELFVEAYSPSSNVNHADPNFALRHRSSYPRSQCWFIFFLNGQIVYATDGDRSLSRLRDYLRHYQIEIDLEQITTSTFAAHNALEYAYLWTLLEDRVLTPAQARNIIHGIVHETLFDLLSLHQGLFIFKRGAALSPQLTILVSTSLATKIVQQVQAWKQLYPQIQSPDRSLTIANLKGLRQGLPAATANRLETWIDGKTSLRQLARYLNRDILTVGKAIYPCVKHGWIQIHTPKIIGTITDNPHLSSGIKTLTITCIDDAIAICQTVETILQQQGFTVMSCSDPLQAFSLLFHQPPDLILCDIVMPILDGYELCAMLRCSNAFRQTPIVMLTGKDGFIDRVRARTVGATDYLTKPFTDSELLMLVEKHLHKKGVRTSHNSQLITHQS
ncbi:response regulator [Chroococcidiopsis sp.]|uniref:response regulator n=1 Tax=Chroococcidiopsis sp. TaxID=3088168 RepID=UPI003F3C17A3